MEYRGFIIRQQEIKTDPVKTQAIRDWTKPRSIKEIQCFLGFCNFYRQFIKEFSIRRRPLYNRTKEKCMSNWERGDKQQAFNELRKNLIIIQLLVHFDPIGQTKIETDASKYICSGILSEQYNDRQWRPVACPSKTRSEAECNYDIHNKELLAIVEVFQEWR